MCRWSRNGCIILIGTLAIGIGLWIKLIKTGVLYESRADLTGRTVLVTGGSAGIGKETAIGLAKQKARVIIASRNVESGEKAAEDIRKLTGSDRVKFLRLDLGEMRDIRRFAKEFMDAEERLDILVNNAGTMQAGKTKDGFNMIFGVNQLGPFLLTNLLMPLLRKTSEKNAVRVVNVSSKAYKFGKINFDNLNGDIDDKSTVIDLLGEYSNTKLMNIYFTSELDKRLKQEFRGEKQAITTYSLHPGSLNTDLGLDFVLFRGGYPVVLRAMWMWLVAKPVFYGAQTVLYCCIEEGIEELSGEYFTNLKQEELWEHATEPEVGAKLWEICEQLSGLVITSE